MSFLMVPTTSTITLIILGTPSWVKISMEQHMSQDMFSKDTQLSTMPALTSKKNRKRLCFMMSHNSTKHSIEMTRIVPWIVTRPSTGIKLKPSQVPATTSEGSTVQQERSTILGNTLWSIKGQFKTHIQPKPNTWGLKKQQCTLSILKDDYLKHILMIINIYFKCSVFTIIRFIIAFNLNEYKVPHILQVFHFHTHLHSRQRKRQSLNCYRC